jgi:hypothetical protein
VSASTASIREVAVSLVASTTTGASSSWARLRSPLISRRTNFDKYHPGYFGKVGMRHFHLTRNATWKPTINIDKLWSLVPAAEREGHSAESDVVPVIDTLHHGYGKVLGNGRCVRMCYVMVVSSADMIMQPSSAPFHRQGTIRLQDCRVRDYELVCCVLLKLYSGARSRRPVVL